MLIGYLLNDRYCSQAWQTKKPLPYRVYLRKRRQIIRNKQNKIKVRFPQAHRRRVGRKFEQDKWDRDGDVIFRGRPQKRGPGEGKPGTDTSVNVVTMHPYRQSSGFGANTAFFLVSKWVFLPNVPHTIERQSWKRM